PRAGPIGTARAAAPADLPRRGGSPRSRAGARGWRRLRLFADDRAHGVEDAVDVLARGDQRRRELEGVARHAHHQAALVAGEHQLEAALARLAGERLQLDRAHQAEVADVPHARQVATVVQRVLEVRLELAHPLEDALLLVRL